MKALTLVIFLFPIFALSADNFLEFGDVNFGRNFKEKSNWLLRLGSETFRYESSFPEYKGEHVTIDDKETDDLNGYAFSFGRDWYFGGGLSSTLSLGAFYSKTLDKIIGKAARDIDLDFSQVRTSHQLTAYEASISLNYLFDYKIVDVQPFIEFGAGVGEIVSEKQYSRRGFSEETNGSEEYSAKVTQNFSLTRVSLGVNFISYKGLMSYFRASTMPLVISDRKTSGDSNVKGSATVNPISLNESSVNETKNVLVLSVGIGSYF